MSIDIKSFSVSVYIASFTKENRIWETSMISKVDFLSAAEGDAFVDVYKRKWTITRRRGNIATTEVDGETAQLSWWNGGIVDDEWNPVPELKHVDAYLKKAETADPV